MITRSLFQDQWDLLKRQGLSDYDRAFIMLCDYAGIDLPVEIDRLAIKHCDHDNGGQVKSAIEEILEWHHGVFLGAKGLCCILPCLISWVKNKLPYSNIELFPDSEPLGHILAVICMNSGLNYAEINTDPTEYIINHWLLSNCTANSLPSIREISRIININQKKLQAEYEDDKRGLISAVSQIPHYAKQNYHIMIECLLAQENGLIQRKKSEMIKMIMVDYFIKVVISLDYQNTGILLARKDVLRALKKNAYYLIRELCRKRLDENQIQYCVSILKQSGILDWVKKNDYMHPKYFISNNNSYLLAYLDENELFTRYFISAYIKNHEEAEYIYLKLLRLSDLHIKYASSCDTLTRQVATSFEIRFDKILHEVMKKNSELRLALITCPVDKFDLMNQELTSGKTILHHMVQNQSSSGKSLRIREIKNIVSINRNCLFVKDWQGKLPSDYGFNWPVARETLLEQVKIVMTGFIDDKSRMAVMPKELLMFIAFCLAAVHCGKHPLSYLRLSEGPILKQDKWVRDYIRLRQT